MSKFEEKSLFLEDELETLKQATGSEEREKAEIMAAEKKARAQVSEFSKLMTTIFKYRSLDNTVKI